MPTASFDQKMPLGISFNMETSQGRWLVIVLNDVAVTLSGDSSEAKFEMNREQLMRVALAKIALGETLSEQIIISLADLHRRDLSQ